MNKIRDEEPIDRRSDFRIRAEIPAVVHFGSGDVLNEEARMIATTLGVKGVSITGPSQFLLGQELNVDLQITETTKPLRFKGKVLSKTDSHGTSEPKYGVSFEFMAPNAREIYYSWMANSLLDREKIQDRRASVNVITELISFQNRSGRKVVGFLDRLIDHQNSKKVIVIPPAYGESKTGSLALSYFLAKNGFHVLRYDATDHVGESDGDILHTTLSGMKMDLLGCLDYIEQRFGLRKVGVIASSLAGRVAIKAGAEDQRIRYIVGLVCVVDLKSTLAAVYRRDLIEGYINGSVRGIANILGFEVCDRFLEDAIQGNFHTLEGTKKDVKQLEIPLLLFGSERDVWVRPDVLRAVARLAINAGTNIFIIPDTLHQIYENRNTARSALKQIVACALRCCDDKMTTVEEIAEPSLREIAMQSRVERQRSKFLSNFEKTDRVEFWRTYLASFHLITKSPDYRSMLEMIYDLLGDFNGLKILDAGCGNGNLAAWCMAVFYRESHRRNGGDNKPSRFSYVGVDYVQEALFDAESRLRQLAAELSKSHKSSACLMDWAFNLSDLNMPLPFIDDYFHKVCCNLVLSYLESPIITLRELRRVLKKGGRIIVTSMKPAADFSRVFENFVAASTKAQELEEAKRLLSNAGFIRYKESEGHFRFYSAEELQRLLADAGFCNFQSFLGFGDQINIVTGEKL